MFSGMWEGEIPGNSNEIHPYYLGKIEGGRRGRQRMRWLDGITDSMEMNLRHESGGKIIYRDEKG